jgi:hypothetical protein
MNRLYLKFATAVLGALAALASGAEAAAPPGWIIAGNAPTDYEFGVASAGSRDGSKSAFIKAKVESSSGFGTLMQTVGSRNYVGSRVRLSAYLRSDDARRGQMWMRIDGANQKVVGFDNMDSRPIIGTTEWKRYEIVLEVPRDAEAVAFGFFLAGPGTVWADGFKLEIVDKSVPLTGTGPGSRVTEPANLGFED